MDSEPKPFSLSEQVYSAACIFHEFGYSLPSRHFRMVSEQIHCVGLLPTIFAELHVERPSLEVSLTAFGPLTLKYDLELQSQRAMVMTHTYIQNIKVIGQSVQKIRMDTDGRTEPIALPSWLMRSLKCYWHQFTGVTDSWYQYSVNRSGEENERSGI